MNQDLRFLLGESCGTSSSEGELTIFGEATSGEDTSPLRGSSPSDDGLAGAIEWLRRQGHSVIQTPSTYWYDIAPGIYQAFPYHRLIQPPDEELHNVLSQACAIGLRYSTPLSARVGHISYHVVRCDPTYCYEQLSKKARYDVHRGLEHAVVEPVSFARLAAEGWELRVATLERQGRLRAENRQWWERLCLSAQRLPSFEAWAALHDGWMVASLLALTVGDCCSILFQQSLTEHLKHGVNHALTFVFTREALKRSKVTRMFYGLHSLDAPASVDRYKFRMGYTAMPVRQRVLFHPWLTPFLNSMGHGVLRRVQRWYPRSTSLAKAEGMVRFYLEGERPLEDQTWPEALKGDDGTLGQESTLHVKE